MLQNRVDPFGSIISTTARGHWMGNRGVLHNEARHILRPFKLKAWITCKLEFNDRKRIVMAPNRYTELFFFDEATSFAAGHRPCFECRRADFKIFKDFWLKGNPEYSYTEKTSINEIDKIIHRERISADGSKVTFDESPDRIPNGTFVLYKNEPFLVTNGLMYLWTPFGYEDQVKVPALGNLTILTPKSIVNTYRAGYMPQIGI
jgi:hypothetical protein